MARLYQLLLLAYPKPVRSSFGRDMLELYIDLRREQRRQRGWMGAASVTARTLGELPCSAFRAHRQAASGAADSSTGKRRTTPETIFPPNPVAPRNGRRTSGIEVALQTLRHSLRNLRKSPGFAAVVVLTLAIGIVANTVVFTVVDGVLLSPLPYENPERLVRVYQSWPSDPEEPSFLAGAAFLAYRELTDVFDGLAGLYTYGETGVDVMLGDEPERILAMPISADMLAVLGVEPALGREFRREEEHSNAGVVMLSYGLWQRYFNGAPDVVGQTLDIEGAPRTVVGVMPAGFRNPIGSQVDIWHPEQLLPVAEGYDPNDWDNHYLSAVGRLREGVTVEQARARIDALVPTYEAMYDDVEGQSALIVPLLEDKVGATRTMLWTLMSAVGMVLLIACVNIAGLFLARGADRSHELAIRAALGAPRRRLISQMLSESLLLGIAGGIAGLLLSFAGLAAVVRLAPDTLPRVAELGIDLRVFGFTAVVTLLTGLLFGMAPALRFSRPDLERSLRQEDRGNSVSGPIYRARGALVVAEVSLALVLLFGAGLLIKSFNNLINVDLGVNAGGVVTYEVHLPDSRYPEGAQRIAFYDDLFARVRAIAGVDSVGAVSFLPSEGDYHQWGLRRLDIDPESERARTGPNVRVIDEDYLQVMGIDLLRGRGFAEEDTLESPRMLLINQVIADELFADSDPIGTPMRLAGREYEIAGVVSNSSRDPLGTFGPDVYIAHDQYATNRNWAMIQTVRTAGDPLAIVDQVRGALGAVDPQLVLYRVRAMQSVVDNGIAAQRFATALMTAFAGVALLLAAIGIYGVLSYTVTQRTHEIGIRMALGADRRQVRALVLRQGVWLAGIGVLVGTAGSLALARWLGSMLFEVRPNDPLVLGAVALCLALVAALAGYLPARRATIVDPMLALRKE